MRIQTRRSTVATALISALIGAAAAVAVLELPGAWASRPSCPDTVMKAVSSDRPVAGAYGCFNPAVQAELQANGIDSDSAFADKVGQNGDYHFMQKTADGGYVYEYDRPGAPHDRVQAALTALGWPKITADLQRGDVGAAWHVNNDFAMAWSDITGHIQSANSQLFTFYVDGDGKITGVK